MLNLSNITGSVPKPDSQKTTILDLKSRNGQHMTRETPVTFIWDGIEQNGTVVGYAKNKALVMVPGKKRPIHVPSNTPARPQATAI